MTQSTSMKSWKLYWTRRTEGQVVAGGEMVIVATDASAADAVAREQLGDNNDLSILTWRSFGELAEYEVLDQLKVMTAQDRLDLIALLQQAPNGACSPNS